jgi:hypothetical protein
MFLGVVFVSVDGGESDSFAPLFPFAIIPDKHGGITDVSFLNDVPAGKHGFIRVDGQHFVNDKGRVIFWGTNICASANFPSKEQSKIVAARLASLGFNCVRLHHLDMAEIWGGWNAKSFVQIDPERLELLDYFIYQLKQNGIYVNINLHVSRTLDHRDGFPDVDKRPSYDKGLDNFYPKFIELQKKYARDLLLHYNKYTKSTYADEPAVALVEINNENSIVAQWSWGGKILTMPEPYSTEFRRQWNDFLKRKYKTTENLKKEWQCQDAQFGNEMLETNKNSKYRFESNKWGIEKDEETVCDKIAAGDVMKIVVQKNGKVSWHPQLIVNRLSFAKDKVYTFTIKIRANKPTSLFCGVRKCYGDWATISKFKEIKITDQWQKISIPFTVDQTETNARFDINGFKICSYEIAETSLKEGGSIGGLTPEQNLESDTIPIIPPRNDNYTQYASDDFCEFLFELEERYWLEMYRFLKEELKVKASVCGTQAGYGSRHTQAKLDYIDAHAYWNHPEFPDKDWSQTNWRVLNTSLVSGANNSEILRTLATSRVYGKPYIVSEFDAPFPNQYAAEALPILAAFGRFQGWDGIFHFAYAHNRDNFDTKKTVAFFDMVGNSVKLAHLPACAVIFRQNGVNEGQKIIRGGLNKKQELDIFKKEKHTWGLNFKGLNLNDHIAMIHPAALDLNGNTTQNLPDLKNTNVYLPDNGSMYFDYRTKNEEGFGINTKNVLLYTGFCSSNSNEPQQKSETTIEGKGIKIVFAKPSRLGWRTVSAVSINGNGFEPDVAGKEIRVLVAATGMMQNSEMKIEKLENNKITFGNKWGKPPVLCEGIPLNIHFPNAKKIICFPLNETGERQPQIIQNKNYIELQPELKTIWYEIIVKNDQDQ